MAGVKVLLVIFSTILCVRGAKDDDDVGRPYEFGFTIDGQQHRHEKKDANGIIQGEFGFITADGVYHVTVYATDENGSFRILSMRNIKISPPLDGSKDYNPSNTQYKPGQSSKNPGAPAKLENPPSTSTTQSTTLTTNRPPRITPTPKGPYRFTTQSTIKPGCAGCGVVTESTKFQFQNPIVNKQISNQLTTNNQIPQLPNYQPPIYPSNAQTPNPQPPNHQPPIYPSNAQTPNPQPPNYQPPIYPSNAQTPNPQPPIFSSNIQNQPPLVPPNAQISNPISPPNAQFRPLIFPPNTPTNTQNQPPFITPRFSTPNPPTPSNSQPPFPPPNYPNNEVEVLNPTQGPPQLLPVSQNLNQYPNPQSLNIQNPVANLQPSISPPNNLNQFGPSSYNQNQGGFQVPVNTLQPPGTVELQASTQAPVVSFSNPNYPVFGNNELNGSPPQPIQNQVSRVDSIQVYNGTINVPNNPPIKIVDKYPGMVDGLPEGITEGDITDLLYKFNYTIGFHGHYEKGLRNGTKIGGYYVNGRDGISRVVTYVADEFGYRPKFRLVNLGLDSPDTPKEGTEKNFGLKSFEFVWYPLK